MRLERVELETVRGRLSRKAAAGRRRIWERSGIRIRLWADGRAGQGEAAPLPGYSPDTWDDVCAALAAFSSLECRLDLSVSAEACVNEALRDVPLELPSARFGLETALLDLLSCLRSEPVHHLLVPATVDESAWLGVVGLVDAEDPAQALTEARRALELGAAGLKYKLAGDRGWAHVEAARRALVSAPIRLDFNQSLPPESVAEALSRAADLDVELVEEPSAVSMKEASSRPACPVFADESLRVESSRQALPGRIADGALAGAVLKPALLGGLFACVELARQVREAGGDVFVSHLFDGPVARAATAELALALGGPLAHGLAPHVGLPIWPAFEPHAIDGYQLRRHEHPGLGTPVKP